MIEHPIEYGVLDLNLSKITCDCGEVAYYLVDGRNGMMFQTREDLVEELELRAALIHKKKKLTAQDLLKATWLLTWSKEFDLPKE